MKDEILKTINFLKTEGVEYTDIRVIDKMTEIISTEDIKVQQLSNARSRGAGIRVILDGSIGFACTQDLENLKIAAIKALEIAKSSRLLQKEKIRMAAKAVVNDYYETPIEINPFSVSKKTKINMLFDAEQRMRESAKLSKTKGFMSFSREDKIYADSDGSFITQRLWESGGGISAYAESEDDIQVRSYKDSYSGSHASAGYEYIHTLNFIENAPIIAREAEQLTTAEECPSGIFDVIIDGSQLAIQIHESIGHAVELDRVFGSEAAYAGTSFLNPSKVNECYRYGSPYVNVVADSTILGGLGTYGYDDDGVKAQSTCIVDKGIFKNFITSRDTAIKLGMASNGCNRADGWKNMPIVRMPNISLMPGDFTLEQLIGGIEKGLYLCTNKSWSIDDKRLNFQFSCEVAYEIKNGKLTGKIYKNPIYTGITPTFWASCDGISNSKYWHLYSTTNCGKGQPSQVAHVGHGAAPSRFRQVKVGVADVK